VLVVDRLDLLLEAEHIALRSRSVAVDGTPGGCCPQLQLAQASLFKS